MGIFLEQDMEGIESLPLQPGARVRTVYPKGTNEKTSGRTGTVPLRRDCRKVWKDAQGKSTTYWKVKLDEEKNKDKINEKYLRVIQHPPVRHCGRRRLPGAEILRLRRRRPTSAEVVLGRLLEEIKS